MNGGWRVRARWLALAVALAPLAACGKAAPAPVAPDVVADAGLPPDVLDAAATAGDGAGSGGSTGNAETAAAKTDAAKTDAGPTPTTFTISSPLALGAGLLHVRLVDFSMPTATPSAADEVLFEGNVALPYTFSAIIPVGTWLPAAGWKNAAGQFEASSFDCDVSGALTVGSGQSGPPTVAIAINTPAAAPPCTLSVAQGFLSEQSHFIVPFPDLGESHLLEGMVWNGAWWMAANGEGLGRVALPTPGKTVSDWQPFAIGDCRHLARFGNRLYCSERTEHLAWMDVDPATNKPTQTGAIMLPPGLHGEGMVVRGDRLFVAAHHAGLVEIPLAPLGQPLVHALPEMRDAWHVIALADGTLAVADGGFGVEFVAVAGGKIQLLGALALPGLPAHLATAGTTLAVGALGGGLHLVDVAQPKAPLLLGTLPAGPWPLVGVDLKDDVCYAAFVRGVLAVPVPKTPQGLLAALAVSTSDSFMALDVRAVDGVAVTADYALVRVLELGGAKPQPGPRAIAEHRVWANLMGVGESAQFIAHVWNPGSATLHLSNIAVKPAQPGKLDQPGPGSVAFTAPAALEIAPGQTAALAVTVKKQEAGVLSAILQLKTDDPSRASVGVLLRESPDLKLGQPLPALNYKDANNSLQSAGALLAGKPGLLLVAAEGCPVAFERLGAIVTEYAQDIAAGKLHAVLINPWETPGGKEAGGIKVAFPHLFSPLTTADGAAWSEVADQILALPHDDLIPPLPLVFVVDKAGAVTYAHLGYAPVPLKAAISALLGK